MNTSRKQSPRWRKGIYVRIIKVGQQKYGMPSCPRAWYTPGTSVADLFSLPMEICLEGYLSASIREGGRIHLDRKIRDGVTASGIFVSSRITRIAPGQIHTCNSVYSITKVPPLVPFEDEAQNGPKDLGHSANSDKSSDGGN